LATWGAGAAGEGSSHPHKDTFPPSSPNSATHTGHAERQRSRNTTRLGPQRPFHLFDLQSGRLHQGDAEPAPGVDGARSPDTCPVPHTAWYQRQAKALSPLQRVHMPMLILYLSQPARCLPSLQLRCLYRRNAVLPIKALYTIMHLQRENSHSSTCCHTPSERSTCHREPGLEQKNRSRTASTAELGKTYKYFCSQHRQSWPGLHRQTSLFPPLASNPTTTQGEKQCSPPLKSIWR